MKILEKHKINDHFCLKNSLLSNTHSKLSLHSFIIA